MKITEVRLGTISVPLRVPFKTALRSVSSVEDIIVEIYTDTGHVGYGEAPPTGAITGHTTGAILGALRDHIIKTIVGRDVDDFEDVIQAVNKCIVGNTSAKAAVDMALYDLYGQLYKIPVYKLFGGARDRITTDITISVNDPEEMAEDTRNAVERGYETLKVKVGVNPELDIARLTAVRQAAGPERKLRIDANQAWSPKQAVRLLNQMQERGLDIEFVEQPVAGHDFEGLKYVTERSYVPVMADESVFSCEDAVKVMQMRAADLVNIKLMKCGGLYNALKIASAAEIYGVECMVGCMLEAKISVNAAVHLACAKKIVTKIDLDGPVLCREDPILGGAVFQEQEILVSKEPGLGIKGIDGLKYLDEKTILDKRL
ncbi:MAG: dipeptide epimerase [Hominisplanchenecus sp.]